VTVLVVLLAVLLVCAVATAVVLASRLRRVRRRLLELEAEVERLQEEPEPVATRSARTAERLVRTVIGTAAKVRDQGFGGLLLESMDDLSRWALEDRSEITRLTADDGSITVFFSDIEGSTALNARLGDDAWMRLLIAHDVSVRAHVDRRHGHVVKSQGDGFMVVFSSPVDAVRAGLAIQRSLSDLRGRRLGRSPFRVRIGIHEGTAIARDGDVFGQTVATAARVAARADGGQILVTDRVADALVDDPRFELEKGAPVELKGLPGDHVLWTVRRRTRGR
jgi:class 3 adenylate cyclase